MLPKYIVNFDQISYHTLSVNFISMLLTETLYYSRLKEILAIRNFAKFSYLREISQHVYQISQKFRIAKFPLKALYT
jgi:hypothetical protein